MRSCRDGGSALSGARRVGPIVMLIGTLTLAHAAGTSAAAPANDKFAGATPITLPYTSPSVDTTEATVDSDDSAVGVACGVGPNNPYASNSVWYTFTAATDAVAHVVASRSNYYLLDPVVTGSPSAGFTSLSCATGPGAEFPVRAGTTYYVDFIAFGAAGGGKLRFSIVASAPGADTDNDGRLDSFDSCPTVAASTLNGCPPEPPEA